MDSSGFETRRAQLIKKYDAQVPTKGNYIVSTKPYVSTLSLEWDIVDANVASQYAYAVARKGQTLDFFSYGIGDQLLLGPAGSSKKATDADTNISKSKQTNGNSDFVVEGLSLNSRGPRYVDAGLTVAPNLVPFPPPFPAAGFVSDPDVIAALGGGRLLPDPASIVTPPQVYSPFNLENAMLQAVLGSCSVQLNWDEDRIEKLGPLVRLAQGGGGSQLRANGMPLTSNIFRVEEGYLWARVGEQDAELVVRVQLQESVVMCITLNNNPADDAQVIAPKQIFQDWQLSLHGFEFKYPSRN